MGRMKAIKDIADLFDLDDGEMAYPTADALYDASTDCGRWCDAVDYIIREGTTVYAQTKVCGRIAITGPCAGYLTRHNTRGR